MTEYYSEEKRQSVVISECLSFADDVLLLDMLPLNLICDMMFSQKHFSDFQVERLWVLRSNLHSNLQDDALLCFRFSETKRYKFMDYVSEPFSGPQ